MHTLTQQAPAEQVQTLIDTGEGSVELRFRTTADCLRAAEALKVAAENADDSLADVMGKRRLRVQSYHRKRGAYLHVIRVIESEGVYERGDLQAVEQDPQNLTGHAAANPNMREGDRFSWDGWTWEHVGFFVVVRELDEGLHMVLVEEAETVS